MERSANASSISLGMGEASELPPETPRLERHFGLLQATALNVTMIVGAGVFISIPLMLKELPGPYALLGWLAAGALILVDGLVWSELGAMLPGSGGSYLYLLECYGRERWGRLMAFLFIWQFLISGPLEVASGLIAVAQFATGIDRTFVHFNEAWTWTWRILDWHEESLTVSLGPARVAVFLLGVGLLVLLYRRIATLGWLTLTFSAGVLLVIGWILVEGWWRFQPALAFDFSTVGRKWPDGMAGKLGAAMILAMYSYLGYYHVCYIGDEVRDPGRTIPRAVMLSAVVVCLLFAGLHLAMLGTVSWHEVPTARPEADNYNLAAEFMRRVHGNGAAVAVSLLLIWSCTGSAFAALLGYSRIPYGAARYGHFFAPLGRVHPVHHIPHVSLLAVGALTLCWCFFDLQSVINALITTRIIEQFIAQVVGLVLFRRRQPGRPRPFKVWLYPLPCGLALAGWVYLYVAAGWAFVLFGLVTLAVGVVAFVVWASRVGGWPFTRQRFS